MSDLRMELIQGQLNDIEENVRSIKATWGNTIMTLDNIKSSLKADRQKAIDEAYQKGVHDGSLDVKERVEGAYQNGYDEAKLIYQNPNAESDYQRGLDDAWEVVRKLYNYWYSNDDIFGDETFCGFIFQHSASEVIDRIKTYEEQQKADEIKVGDEVEWEGEKIIVTQTFTPNLQKPQLHGIGSNGCVYYAILIEDVKKTGRHFPQVVELIKAMKEGAK